MKHCKSCSAGAAGRDCTVDANTFSIAFLLGSPLLWTDQTQCGRLILTRCVCVRNRKLLRESLREGSDVCFHRLSLDPQRGDPSLPSFPLPPSHTLQAALPPSPRAGGQSSPVVPTPEASEAKESIALGVSTARALRHKHARACRLPKVRKGRKSARKRAPSSSQSARPLALPIVQLHTDLHQRGNCFL